MLSVDESLLYLPPHAFIYQSSGYLSEPSTDAPLTIARNYLATHGEALGVTAEQAWNAIVTKQYTDDATGLMHIYLRQQHAGYEVVNANVSVNVMADGRVLNVGGGFVPDKVIDVGQAGVILSAAEGLAVASTELEIAEDYEPTAVMGPAAAPAMALFASGEASVDEIPARLHYVATADGLCRAWNYVLRTPDGDHWYNASVDAGGGEIVFLDDWTSQASYNVLALPTENPDDGSWQLVTDPADATYSPYGWHDTNGVAGAEYTDTRGNNVFAQEDTDYNNTGGTRPDGGTELVFNFTMDASQTPSAYQSATVTNLFYLNNVLHDVHARYGFTEAAGNFQQINYTGEGLGNDAVQADDQDGSGTNNANFGTPPDGQAPRMQMYIWTSANPDRDSSLENQIVIHEYGHGVSHRLVGGGSGLVGLQAGGMGEGWSDWWALMFTQKPSDTKTGSYPTGTYVMNQPLDGAGIRRYPYAFDMSVNPLTYGNYNTSSEVHNTGEIWCSALWDMTWLLIDKYGYDANIAGGYAGTGGAGNLLALQLVMDGLKLMPAGPTFLDGRDAILQADQVLTGGANQKEIWTAFARRGMGVSADDGGSSNATTVTEAFDVPTVAVASHTPAGVSLAAVAAMDFHFYYPMDVSSFALADDLVSFTGPANVDLRGQITGASWTNSQTLHVTFAAQSVDGLYTMVIGPQILSQVDHVAMDQDGDGIAGETVEDRYAGSFRYDSLVIGVTATSPAAGSQVTLPMTSLEVSFSEPCSASSLGTDDLTLSQGSVTAVTAVDADTVRYTLTGITEEATLTVTMAAGAVADLAGNPMSAWSASYTGDAGTLGFPTPLAAFGPVGSLAQTRGLTAWLNSPNDFDRFTIDLQAGQVFSAWVDPTVGVRPRIEVYDTSGCALASATANFAGEAALTSAFVVPADSTYTMRVSSPVGSTGQYWLHVAVGLLPEKESHGGATNDRQAAAEDLALGFVSLSGGSSCATVWGTADGNTADWHRFSLAQDQWTTVALDGLVSAAVELAVFDEAGNQVAFTSSSSSNVDRAVSFAAPTAGTYYVQVTGSIAEYALVVTRGASFELENNDTAAEATSIAAGGQVLGSLGVEVREGLYYLWDARYAQVMTVDASGNLAALGASGINYTISGLAFDSRHNILYGIDDSGHFATFDLATGEATLRPNLSGSVSQCLAYNPVDDQLYSTDDSGALVRIDPTTSVVTRVSTTWAGNSLVDALTYSPADGRFYALSQKTPKTFWYDSAGYAGPFGLAPLTLTGYQYGITYNGTNLVLGYDYYGSNAAGRTLYNYDPLTGAASAAAPANLLYNVWMNDLTFRATAWDADDYYQVDLLAGETIQLSTTTPGVPPLGSTALDARLELYDSDGRLVASDDNSLDGRNALLSYTVATAGTYLVRVAVVSGAGSYVLGVTGSSLPQPALTVVSTVPADGASAYAPTAVTVTFSADVLLSSVQGADLTVDGVATVLTDGWAVDARTVTFTLSQGLAQGTHSVTLAAGAVASTSGVGLTAYSGSFASDWGLASLVADINLAPGDASPASLVNVNGTLFFVANDSVHGAELWKSDGTAAGTSLVKDIFAGASGASISNLVDFNGTLHFSANDGVNGAELWKSDGTASGTTMVKNISGAASPQNLTVVGSLLFYSGYDSTNGTELWKSDGTASGTTVVKNICAGSGSSSPAWLTNYGGTLLFTASDGVNGSELWRSDGTSANTYLVKDLYAGSNGSSCANLAVVGLTLFLVANDGTSGTELWKSDGTESGTVIVKDIFSGSGSSSPTWLTNFNGTLVFAANDGASGTELWTSDGSESGTAIVKDIYSGTSGSSPANLVNAGGVLYFAASTSTNGRELWKSDGTDSGTVLVKDINAGSNSSPTNLCYAGGIVYMQAYTPDLGYELWKSDGTAAGTRLVSDIRAGTANSSPANLTSFQGLVVFTANDGLHGAELWESDGTLSGTVLVKDVRTDDSDASPASLVDVGGTLFFTAYTATGGTELWRSGGTADTTAMVKDIVGGSGSSYPTSLTNVNGTLFFRATSNGAGSELWKSDGTASGTVMVKDLYTGSSSSSPANFCNVGGVLFFQASSNGAGVELWRSDGTEAGTYQVKDIAAGTVNSSPAYLTNVRGTLFFAATDGTNGVELWRSDGTAAGTVMVKDIHSSGNASPAYLTNVNGTLFFAAYDSTNGTELWCSDGTADGTVIAKNIASGSTSSSPYGLQNLNGVLLFRAYESGNGTELWRSDGTDAGTAIVKDIYSGTTSSSPANLTVVGNTLFFTATDASNGSELWMSDGTLSGTTLVKNIAAGSASSAGQSLVNLNGRLYFTANDGVSGREVWTSDGTDIGTVLAADIQAGSESSDPLNLTVAGARLYFTAVGLTVGRELHALQTVAGPSTLSLAGTTITEGQPVGTAVGTLSATDPNAGTTFTYALVPGPGGDDNRLFTITDSTLASNAVLDWAAGTVCHVRVRVTNAAGASLEQAFVVQVGSLNDAPLAAEDMYTLTQGSLTVAGPGVLGNDSDPNDDPLTATLVVTPLHGSVALNADGGFVYTPTTGFNGTDMFSYSAVDSGSLSSAATTVFIQVQKATMTLDVNAIGQDSSAANYIVVGGTVFFTATDTTHGTELWRTDGTESGTVLVKDIYSGTNSSSPAGLTEFNGMLYFSAATSANGRELWRSDGTEAGTTLVADIAPATANSNPVNLVNVGDTLYFQAWRSGLGNELFKSDGTEVGTTLVKDIYSGANNSSPASLTNVAGTLFFLANDGTTGVELWKSDGTSDGTVLVKDIFSGSGTPAIANLATVGGTLFFTANDGTTGVELWRSDGTSDGTTIVLDIYSGSGSSRPAYLVNLNGTLLFRANDGTTGIELWRSDGSVSGTTLVKDIVTGTTSSSPSYLVSNGAVVCFAASDGGTGGTELWRSDGTASGTYLVRNIAPDQSVSSSPNSLVNVNGVFFFVATLAGFGAELWRSDGTSSGTTLVRDIWPGMSSPYMSAMTNCAGTLYFTTSEGIHGREPWLSDGTAGGTALLKDIRGGTPDATPTGLIAIDQIVYFAASDGLRGTELWRTGGTQATTVLVKDIYSGTGSSSPSNLVNVNGTLFFTASTSANGAELWKSDGTAAGTVMVLDIYSGSSSSSPSRLVNVGGTLYFTATNATNGTELWRSDGTAGNTVLVKDIVSGTASPSIANLTAVGNLLFFTANDSVTGTELWRSDGTADGTYLVADLNPGSAGSNPVNLTAVNGTLFFTASTTTTGAELFMSDGTPGGASLVRDIYSGTSSSSPSFLVNFKGMLYFAATDSANGTELWCSDGTSGGTTIVKNIYGGSSSASPQQLFVAGESLFFSAVTSANGRELWKTTGSEATTVLVKDIWPGLSYSSPYRFVNADGTVYFVASDGTNGYELWRTDGTSAGTTLAADLWAGTAAGDPQSMTAVGASIAFTASNGLTGREVWVWSDQAAPTVVSVARVGSEFTQAPTVQFTVAFDQAVTGVDASDFVLSGSGAADARVLDVSPADASSLVYTVTVSTGGNGTLRLDVCDDDTILAAFASALGGLGTGNGDFVVGQAYTVDDAAPALQSLTPQDDATNVAGSTALVMTFTEAMQKAASGSVVIRRVSDNSLVQTIAISDAGVSVVGDTVTIVLGTALAENTGYWIAVDAGALVDLAGNSFAGISDPTAWNFTTGDFTRPTVVSLSPADNAAGVACTVSLVVTFNETVQLGAGQVVVRKSSDASVVQTIDVAGGQVTIADTTATIGLTNGLEEDTGYYVEVPAGAFTDLAGNLFLGISGADAWNFATGDFTAPAVVTLAPDADTTGVTSDVTLSIVFSETVQKGTGSIRIARVADDTVVATIAASGDRVTIAGGTVTIDPTDSLSSGTAYYVLVDAGAFEDLAGNDFAGIADSATWRFSTVGTKNLDADGNGTADALTDGILILRYLFDPAGAWNFSDALGSGAVRTTRATLRAFLDDARSSVLDVDANGAADALTDGILILRYLFDPAGAWNFSDALGSGATRTTRASLRAFLDQYNPAGSKASAVSAASVTETSGVDQSAAVSLPSSTVALVGTEAVTSAVAAVSVDAVSAAAMVEDSTANWGDPAIVADVWQVGANMSLTDMPADNAANDETDFGRGVPEPNANAILRFVSAGEVGPTVERRNDRPGPVARAETTDGVKVRTGDCADDLAVRAHDALLVNEVIADDGWQAEPQTVVASRRVLLRQLPLRQHLVDWVWRQQCSDPFAQDDDLPF